MTTLAMTSANSLLCHASTCLRIGSKFRCIRSTPTEMESMSENDFECFASTGVNTPGTMLLISVPVRVSTQEAESRGTDLPRKPEEPAGREATRERPAYRDLLAE